MTTASNSGPLTGDGPRRDTGQRVDHLPVGVAPSSPTGRPDGNHDSWEWQLGELLAPFVAWLATQGIDEPDRRRHRVAAERFLRWSRTDTGPVENRRRRYEHHLDSHDPEHLSDARAGLDQWTDHRRILARTRSADQQWPTTPPTAPGPTPSS